MPEAYINRIETAVPDHDVHRKFIAYALMLLSGGRDRTLFRRMAERSQIAHRYSFLSPHEGVDSLDRDGFYRDGGFPGTAARMAFYQRHAFPLALRALDRLEIDNCRPAITHLIVTSCTGFYAPGLDWEIVRHYRLRPSVERTMVGFMGCHAAMHALKLARHIVRADEQAQVLIVNIELCTLHLQQTGDLEKILSFLIFADGCAASLISARPEGLALKGFHAALLENSRRQITWDIGDSGFDMVLSGCVPRTIAGGLAAAGGAVLGGRHPEDFAHWAVHPGGRSVLDAVEKGLSLPEDALGPSRDILQRFGNMSSPAVMFVLRAVMERAQGGEPGCALAFGPGLSVESLLFEKAGGAA